MYIDHTYLQRETKDPCCNNVKAILTNSNYLTNLFFLTNYMTGVGYSALKTAKSAVSNVISLFVKPFNERNIQLSTFNAEIYSGVRCFSCAFVLKFNFFRTHIVDTVSGYNNHKFQQRSLTKITF